MATTDPRELLVKPPRLLSSGNGYDWREFDRWLQKLYLMLGSPSENTVYNIPKLIDNNSSNITNNTTNINNVAQIVSDIESSMPTDSSFQIIALRKLVDDLVTEINMLTDQRKEVHELQQRMNDVSVEIGVS